MKNHPATSYSLDVASIATVLPTIRLSASHRDLSAALAKRWPGIRLVTQRGGKWLARQRVWRDGEIVGEDLATWLAIQNASDGGNVRRTHERLKESGYFVSKIDITDLHFVVDAGSDHAWEFLQVDVELHEERLDRPLCGTYAPRSLHDWIRYELGYALPASERKMLGSPQYHLENGVDVGQFLAQASALEIARRAQFRQKLWRVQEQKNGSVVRESVQTSDEIFPGWDQHSIREQRIFDDWMASSAGRSGARFCQHWVLQFNDYTNPKGERTMNFVPAWAPTVPIAAVDAGKGSDHDFIARLEKFDRRVKMPFGWYFYMLHGNRLESEAGDRAIALAEQGLLQLPEHDYRVLKRWQDKPYGF